MDEMKDFQENCIIRILMNEATPEEVSAVEAWIAADSANRLHFLEIQKTWNNLEVERQLTSSVLEEDWSNISHPIQPKNNSTTIRSLGYSLLKLTAVVTVGVLSYLLMDLISTATMQPNYTVITTPNGSKTEIQLPDNSKVWLNAGSTLKYSDDFKENDREVYLDGEAFFEISKDHQKKFLVKTDVITIQVYGTSFNVKSYNTENTTETTLIEGKISLTRNDTHPNQEEKEILLQPKQQVIVTSNKEKNSSDMVILTAIDPTPYTSWRDGELIIKSESFETLATKLERKYGVTINFIDAEVKDYRFTGTIKNETINEVLSIMELASAIDYNIKNNVVTIRKRK